MPLLYISRNSAGNLRGCENLRFRKFPWKFAIAQYWLCRLNRISCARSASANHHAFASRSLFGPRTTSALLQRARRGVPSHQSLSRAPWMRAHIHIYRARRAFPVRCAPPECGGERQRLHARDHDRQVSRYHLSGKAYLCSLPLWAGKRFLEKLFAKCVRRKRIARPSTGQWPAYGILYGRRAS